MEPSTGRLPNYGNNEGALVLPLDECDYTDFRPVLQAAHFVAHRERRLESGPWDEDLLWLFGSEALTASRVAPKPPKSAAFPSGGYYTLRSADSWCMLRCHTYRDRPAHIDPLHLDLWWRGVNVLHDPGTYYYYTPDQPELERYFKSITAHNTIAIDDAQPVEWVSRFLCFPWPTATLLRFDPALNIFEGEHTTYNRRPWHCKHRRCVIAIAPDIWLVIDDIFGRGHHTATLRWHAPDFPHEFNADAAALTLNTPHGPFSMRVATESDPLAASLLRARKSPPVGFAAPYYAELQPALTLEALTAGPVPLRLVTLLCPGRDAELMLDEPEKDSQTVRVLAKGEQRNVRLNPPGPRTAIFALA